MAERNSLTPRRRRLGVELKKLRDRAGLTTTRVSELVEEMSQSKVSRLERGVAKPKVRDVEALLRCYGADDETLNAVMALAREAKSDGWWHAASSSLPPKFRPFIGMEDEATEIRNVEPAWVPGLVQTEDYARAVLQADVDNPPEVVEEWLAVRMARQQLLDRDEPPLCWIILDECALVRQVGGPEVMHGQLDYLLEVVDRPRLVLQVIPLSAGSHPLMSSNMFLLAFAHPEVKPVIYHDTPSGGLSTHNPRDVERGYRLWEYVRGKALDPQASVALIRERAKRP